MRERLHRFDAAARRLAGPKWKHVKWHEQWHPPERSSRGIGWLDYSAVWCLRSDQPSHVCAWSTERPVHCIRLRARPFPDSPKRLREFSLNVKRHGDRGDWGVSLFYANSKSDADSAKVGESFDFVFFNEEYARPGSVSNAALSIPGGRCGVAKKFGQYEYSIGAFATNLAGRRALEFVASAETLRDAGLAVIDSLEPAIRQRINAGEATVTDHGKTKVIVEDSRDGSLEQEVPLTVKPPLPPEYRLTDQQKQEILDKAIAELERRRRLLREHYQEMYAAVQAAVPLCECLAEP